MGYALGLSCFYHDSAACLLDGGKILAAAQEERFVRVKNDPSFPACAIKFCLEDNGLSLSDIDTIVFYDKPFLKLERILETHLNNAPFGLPSFLQSLPSWLGDKFNFRRLIKKELESLNRGKFQGEIFFSEHHLSHAASSFYTSPFSQAAVLTIDGVGEWATLSISIFDTKRVRMLKEMRFPDSIGLLYSAFTYYCGFKVNSGEYKLMGLAPYGHRNSSRVEKYISLIKQHVVTVHQDGSISLNQDYFSYQRTNCIICEQRFHELFNLPVRIPESLLNQEYCDIAMAIQVVTEEIVLKLAHHAKEITNQQNLCLAGGVALNCVANGLLDREKIFDQIWIQPAAGDAGGALGAALAHYYAQNEYYPSKTSFCPFLGPYFSDKEILSVLKQNKSSYIRLNDSELYQYVAQLLLDNKVCGWFQGRMEWGPRALGNRSILANSTSQEMQRELNLKIKFRESFRPFAPVVMEEHASEYFDGIKNSPYMLFTYPIAKQKRIINNDQNDGGISVRLERPLSRVPAVTHVDYSARVQTVNVGQNERLYHLLESFYAKSSTPLLINTSFNVRGEPIVCTPCEAFQCFVKTDMDALIMNNYVILKNSYTKQISRKNIKGSG